MAVPIAPRHRVPFPAVVALVLVAMLAACGGDDPDQPPEISYGRDVCDSCRMIISEPRFAAAYRASDGTVRRFDDLGDMVTYGLDTAELDGARAWVHDYETEEWIEAPEAIYVLAAGLETPMSRGVVGFAESSRAEAYGAEVEGRVLDWEELVQVAREGGLEPQGPVQEDRPEEN